MLALACVCVFMFLMSVALYLVLQCLVLLAPPRPLTAGVLVSFILVVKDSFICVKKMLFSKLPC